MKCVDAMFNYIVYEITISPLIICVIQQRKQYLRILMYQFRMTGVIKNLVRKLNAFFQEFMN